MPSTRRQLTLPTLLLLTLTTLLTSTLAQVGTVLDANQLPSCAFNCPAITNAQTVCVPPAAPATNQATYQSCFCNSAYLTAFKGTAFVDICNGVCSQNDLSVVRAWYTNLCQAGGAVVTPLAQNAAAATNTAAGAATTTAASAAAATSTTRYYDPNPQGSWISTHYNWLIFIIVIILAAIAAIFLGRWLKKRHNRRVADMRAAEHGLAAEQAAAAIRSNLHPSEMTFTQPSGVMRNSLKSRDRFSMYSNFDVERLGTPGAARADMDEVPAMPVGLPAGVLRGDRASKERMSLASVRDLGVGGDSMNSVPGSEISRTASPLSAAGERRKSTLRKSMR